MASLKEIDAAVAAYNNAWDMAKDIDARTAPKVRREAMIAALIAAEQAREVARRENCRHPMKNSTGRIGSDGSGSSDWSCPNCGQSGHEEWGPRDTTAAISFGG